ncbi:beta-barrel assembly-enhancing protease [Methylomarinovum tepidoasis]|uniref:Putative beta-barrel assembly-enhancing protease n=1 Tax=Methylomarinovum tepidoasis TaxID=2840183 RepID=A0AAU9CPG9_9GAMM|nr:M48 family metalloprotease [Methylomarinovum sp. IN45]BCX88188.1 beta-barrel assembly-enhancing protease [Methylomarinovum sp. IN45]
MILWLLLAGQASANLPPLPDMGAASDALISPAEERRLGQAFFRSLHQHLDISTDPEIQDYIASLGTRLTRASDASGRPFHFFVVMQPEINAFAGPGGYIGVHSGLILATRNESELASVMAHEIAHVTQNHLKRAIAAAKRLTLPMAAAMLAAILIGTQSPQAAQAALIALQAGSLQHQINFTRSHEQEADRIGLQILAESGFDPRAMPSFFERLQQNTRFSGAHVPEFLRTHPVTSSRIADTRARAAEFPYHQYTDSFAYQLTKAKLQVLSSDDLDALRRAFANHARQGTIWQRAAARYGMALIDRRQHRFSRSARIFAQLLAWFPEQPRFIHGLASVELAQGRTEAALARYRQALRRFPASSVLRLEYAKALLESGRFESARQILGDHILERGQRHPVLFKYLAQAYSGLEQRAEARRYLAEYAYARGDLEDALRHMRAAVRLARGDRILSAITRQRLREFLAEKQARER